MLLNDLGPHSAEEARLRKELAKLGLDRDEYLGFVRRFANVVEREMVLAGGGDCPVCDQFIVSPNWRPPIRWLARGLVNAFRTAYFMFELALVSAVGFLALGAVREILQFIFGRD